MNPYVTIALTCASLIFFAAYFFFSRANYSARFQMKYDVRNTFPFEFNYQGKFKDNLIGNICLLFYLACSVASYTNFEYSKSGLMIFVMVVGIFSNLMVVVATIVPLKILKGHILTAVFLFLGSFLNPSAIAIVSLNIYKTYKTTMSLVVVILSLVLAVFAFVLIMNPNLTKWSKAIEEPQADGTVKYIRPKYMTLAFSEWLAIFNTLVNMLLLIMLTFSL